MTVVVETPDYVYQRLQIMTIDKKINPKFWILIYEDGSKLNEPKEYNLYIDGRQVK